MNWIAQIYEHLRPHWSTVALAITWAGVVFAAWRRRSYWQRKQFNEAVNFSLNYVSGGELAMRTLLETTTNRVWLNDYGVGLIRAACNRTTAEQPFILLKNSEDFAFVNRAVLNALSERYSETFLAAAMGVPVRTATFFFALTYERYDIMRTFKLRVLLVEDGTLVRLFGPQNEAAGLHSPDPWRQARLSTLRGMYDLYVKSQSSAQPLLNKVELGIVARTSAPES